MEGGAMPKLLHLLHDEDASCRTKALLALSCLIRLNPLALEVFRQKRGIPQLIQAADNKDIKVQRKALHLLRHVVQAHPPDSVVACQLGALHQAASHLASSDDDTWQAALALIQQLAKDTQSAQSPAVNNVKAFPALRLLPPGALAKSMSKQDILPEAKLQSLTGEDREAKKKSWLSMPVNFQVQTAVLMAYRCMRGVEACITERSPATGIFVEQAVEEGALMEKDKELVDGVQGVEELTFQLSASTSVITGQNAELSEKEAQVKRLDGGLSEQQTRMMQLQSVVADKEFELQRFSAEKQCVVESKQAVIGELGHRLTASQEEEEFVQQEKAMASIVNSPVYWEGALAWFDEKRKGAAAAAAANKAVIKELLRQLDEQQPKLAAQRSQIETLQQCLASTTQQLAADHSNALQAYKVELHNFSTLQLAEKQSAFEGKQAEIDELEQRLTGNIEEVSARQQEKASAAQAHSAASQAYESKFAALGRRLEEEREGKAAAAEGDTRILVAQAAAVSAETEAKELKQQLSDAQAAAESAQGDAKKLQKQLSDAFVSADGKRLQQQLAEAHVNAKSAQAETTKLQMQLSDAFVRADLDAKKLQQQLKGAQALVISRLPDIKHALQQQRIQLQASMEESKKHIAAAHHAELLAKEAASGEQMSTLQKELKQLRASARHMKLHLEAAQQSQIDAQVEES
ncbi:hypothetical protein WJX77_004125 [Trebouxia sp. C0004]